MICKPRKLSIKLQQLEALLRRLRIDHPYRDRVEKDYNIRRSGYRGELQMDYELSFLRDHQFFILNDLRLPHRNNKYFQMDSLLVSPSLFLLLDAKNPSGEIHIDHEFSQMIHTFNNEKKYYTDPTEQGKRHELQLNEWLKDTKNSSIPMESLVVFTHQHTFISTSSGHPDRHKIIKGPQLTEKIKQLEAKYTNELKNKKELMKIVRQLQRQHTPVVENVFEKYQLSAGDIIPGIFCPECSRLSMRRVYSKWICERCKHSSNTVHLRALREYSLLFGTAINNTQARYFLQTSSRSVTHRLLASMKLPVNGNGKKRVYYLPIDE